VLDWKFMPRYRSIRPGLPDAASVRRRRGFPTAGSKVDRRPPSLSVTLSARGLSPVSGGFSKFVIRERTIGARTDTSIRIYTMANTDTNTSTPYIAVSHPLLSLDQTGRLENASYLQLLAHSIQAKMQTICDKPTCALGQF